ncbi:MAG TPA: WD40 repeat domain-containing protein [Bellilinea sp.]|nr:WD40 repeat domain-containing protein [Bellilinea sp.]
MTKSLLVIPIVIGLLLASCGAKNGGKELPNTTPEPTPATLWRVTEAAIAEAVLGTPEGKCEWEMLGWMDQERYIWAVCTSGPGVEGGGASGPAAIRLSQNGSIQSISLPGNDADFAISVRQIFPPAVQEKIFTPDFDMYFFVSRLEQRWKSPTLPPLVYTRTRDTFPAQGEAALPSISAATANRIAPLAQLGQGNVRQVQFLPNDQIVLSGDRGIGLMVPEDSRIYYQFQNLLKGRPAFLSPDAKYLASIYGQTVSIFEVATESLQVIIDTSAAKGIPRRVQFLADGMTIVVEKYIPSEGFPTTWVALFRLSDGELIDSWIPEGNNFVLSPNGFYLAGLFNTAGLQLWSIPNAQLLHTLPVVASAASFSADGQILAVVEMTQVSLFWVWDGVEIGHLEKGMERVSGVALSPDGKSVLTWSDGPEPARLWAVPDFKLIKTFEIQGISSAAFKPDGTAFVMVGDSAILIYNVVPDVISYTLIDIYNQVTDLSFAPDRTYSEDQRLAVAYQPGSYHSVIVNWDLTTNEELFIRRDDQAISLEYAPEPYGIALGTPGKTVRMIDDDDGHLLREFTGPSSAVQGLEIDTKGHLAASSMSEVRIYSLSNPDEKKGRDIRISGGWVSDVIWPCYLAAAVDNGSVQVLDERAEEKLQSIIMPAPGNTIILAAARDCSYLLAAQEKSVYPLTVGSWELLPSWELPDFITALAVSQDGSLAAVGLADGSIQLLDSATGQVLQDLTGHIGAVTALKFSPDGSVLASGGADGVVMIWGVE